jgi:hypothetical protein
MSIVRLLSFQAPEMRCFHEIQAVAALTTVKIVELLFEWGKRFSAGYAEALKASRSLPGIFKRTTGRTYGRNDLIKTALSRKADFSVHSRLANTEMSFRRMTAAAGR